MNVYDYQPSEDRRQLWEVQLEMTDVLLEFCEQHNLKIWACFGTLLGAVRHKGFIPWDDDVDFVMLRKDYDRLLEISSVANLPNNYSFDTMAVSVIKLRKNDTTMLLPAYSWNKKVNQGVWLDIFALDVAPDNPQAVAAEYRRLKKQLRMNQNRQLYSYSINPRWQYKLRHLLLRVYFIFVNVQKHRERIDVFLRNEAKRSSGKKIWPWLIFSEVKDADKVARFDISWFDETVMLPFENRFLPCPVGYEELLTAQYGDWRTPVIGTSLHEGSEVILNKPYKEVIEDRLSKMPWWKRYFITH